MSSTLRQAIPNGFYLGNIVPGGGRMFGSLADEKPALGQARKILPARQKAADESLFTSAAVVRKLRRLTDAERIAWEQGQVTPAQRSAMYDAVAREASRLEEILSTDFNSITPENQGKWESISPARGEFYFDELDEIVDFAEANGMRVRGHTLLWHNQNPQWVLDLFAPGAATDEELLAILREHITTVVGRYAGRIAQWDVANEIVNDDATWRQGNPWIDRFGLEIVAEAFRLAHAADPTCELFLNDYNVEAVCPKSDVYYQLCRDYLAAGVPIQGFGMQGHLSMQYEYPETLRENIQRFTDLGLKVELTEVDIRFVLPPDGGEIPAETLEKQAQWYTRMIDDALANPGCTGFTIWGASDNYSWIPGLFKGEGAATLFDSTMQPKPAYFAVEQALQHRPVGG